MFVKNFIAYFALTVFPAPLSPEITIACLILFSLSYLKEEAATENMFGSKDFLKSRWFSAPII